MATIKTSRAASAAGAPAQPVTAPQSTEQEKPKFPCSMEDFFPYARLAYLYCEQNLDKLAKISPRFTSEFVANQVKLIDETEETPTFKERLALASTARVQLETDNQAVRSLAKTLKSCIQYAFKDKVVADIQLKSADVADISSLRNTWSPTAAMIKSANKYITSNLDLLLANENMEKDFPTKFENAGIKFNLSWADFIAKEKLAVDGTNTQDKGIFAILAELLPMLETGKQAFEFDATNRKKFTSTDLLNEVRGKHPAGVKGFVLVKGTDKAKAKVRVELAGQEGKVTVTDERGWYEILAAAGRYEVRFTAEDILPLTVKNKVVKPGVKSRLSVQVELKPVEVQAPASPPDSQMEQKVANLVLKMQEKVQANGELETV